MTDQVPTTEEQLHDLHQKIADVHTKLSTDDRSFITKYFKELMLSLMTASIIGSVGIVYSSSLAITTMQTQITYISQQLSDLKSKMDSISSSYVEKADYTQLETRVRILENNRGWQTSHK